MSFENTNSPDEKPKTLAEQLPFLQEEKSEDTDEYYKAMREANKLMADGKIMEAVSILEKWKGKRSNGTEPEFTDEQEQAFTETRAKIVESLGYKVESNEGKWLTLSKDGHTVQLKHFMLPSDFGYKEGRISGISIGNNNDQFSGMHWDDGQMVEIPKDPKIIAMFEELVHYLN